MRRILLDQNIPFPLARQLVGHDVVHTSQRSWGHLTNGDLLAAAQRNGFADITMAGSRDVGLASLQDGWMKPQRLLKPFSQQSRKFPTGSCLIVQLHEIVWLGH